MESLVNWYNGRRVLITGAHGFKGSWLSLALNTLGSKILGYGLINNSSILFHNALREKKSNIKFIEADICDNEKLKLAFDRFKPDVVFHLAADPLVSSGFLTPLSMIKTNTLGTVNVLENIRECESITAFINVTTDKVYKNLNDNRNAFKEEDPLGGDDPYSASKACSELITHAYQKSFFMSRNIGIATARAGNVIGIGDLSSDRLIPDIIRAELAGNDIKIRSPRSIRPWQNVTEPIIGYIKLAYYLNNNPSDYRGAYNFGPSEDQLISVEEIVKFLKSNSIIKQKITYVDNFINEKKNLVLSSSKAEKILGWKNNSDLEDELVDIFKGYNLLFENCDVVKFCEEIFKGKLRNA